MTVHHTRALFQEVAALSNLPLRHTALSQRSMADFFCPFEGFGPASADTEVFAEQTDFKTYI